VVVGLLVSLVVNLVALRVDKNKMLATAGSIVSVMTCCLFLVLLIGLVICL
jgi:uncharacterized membrane protein YgaE (UPF0421/DUF939 family)